MMQLPTEGRPELTVPVKPLTRTQFAEAVLVTVVPVALVIPVEWNIPTAPLEIEFLPLSEPTAGPTAELGSVQATPPCATGIEIELLTILPLTVTIETVQPGVTLLGTVTTI